MKALTKVDSFVNHLANQYTLYFDVYRDTTIDDMKLDFLALHKRRDERYMFTKKVKIYGIDNQEIVFATRKNNVTKDFIHDFKQTIENNCKSYIEESDEHMSTIVYGIIVTEDELERSILKEVTRYRKLKFLKFGLHGWVEFYLTVVNPVTKHLWVHAKGKPFVANIENLFDVEGENL